MLFVVLPGVFFIQTTTVFMDKYLSQKYTSDPPAAPYTHTEFKEIVPFNKRYPGLEAQSPEWRDKMKGMGQQLNLFKVGLIYFLHGTFVGDDPFGAIDGIRNICPELSPKLKKVNFYIKKGIDKLIADNGNYLEKYVELFGKAIGNGIPCKRFIWSSENHHLGRLKETVKLVETLAKDIEEKELSRNGRIVLIGHSHAGQLFALLTNFLTQPQGVDELLKAIVVCGVNSAKFNEALKVIREVQLDIVTFGTPPRYGWGKGNYRLLNIINHRGQGYLGGCIKGLLRTKDGDYIQQWGISGTDIPALVDNRINKRLDRYLGAGFDIRAWLRNMQARMRVPHYGETILVDYKDSSLFFPNCTKNLFGHGIYTKFEKMLFNTQLIVNRFYVKNSNYSDSTPAR